MGVSADLCLYVLAVHDQLLSEGELEAALAQATDSKKSLNSVLRADPRVDRHRLDQLIEQRERYAQTCVACGATNYVLPAQETNCEKCGAALNKGQALPRGIARRRRDPDDE